MNGAVNRLAVIILLSLLPTLASAAPESLLLTANQWLKNREGYQARVYCSLRGHNLADASIRCSTEIMQKLDSRVSFATERAPLSADGRFSFQFAGETVRGEEAFLLSGKVVPGEGAATKILFDTFKHSVTVMKWIKVYDLTFRDFSAETTPFARDFTTEGHERDQKDCQNYVEFEQSRVPRYCEFHGFPHSSLEFPVNCVPEPGNGLLMQSAGHCRDY